MSNGPSAMAFPTPASGAAFPGGELIPALQQRANLRLGSRAEAEQQGQFGEMMNQQAIRQTEEAP